MDDAYAEYPLMHVFFQGSSHSTLASDQAAKVFEYQRRHSDGNQIYSPDTLITEQWLQRWEGSGVTDLDGGKVGLRFSKTRIGARGECVKFIIESHQIAQPSRVDQRNHLQICYIQCWICQVCLDGFTESNTKLLACIGGDTLGGIGHEGVGEPNIEHFVDEGLGVKDFWIDDHWHALIISNALNQTFELGVPHLFADQGMAEEASIDCESGVQRIEARGHFHALDVIDGIPVGEVDTCLLQRWTAIGKIILDDQILRLLCIDEGGGVGVFVGDDEAGILKTVGFQHLLDRLIGPG